MLTDTAGAVRHLEARMDQRFTGVELRLTALDQKLDQKVDGNAAALNQKIDGHTAALNRKIDGNTAALNQKIDAVEARLEQKMDSHFRWLVGILFAMFIAMLSSVLAG